MKIRPLSERILVKIVEKKQAHSALIILDKQTAVEICEVLAGGNPILDIKVGDLVLVHREHMLPVDGGMLVAGKDILAVVEE